MRSVDITLTEKECDVLIELILSRQRVCRNNAESALKNGYGSGTSIDKADKWRKAEDELVQLCNKISDRLI